MESFPGRQRLAACFAVLMLTAWPLAAQPLYGEASDPAGDAGMSDLVSAQVRVEGGQVTMTARFACSSRLVDSLPLVFDFDTDRNPNTGTKALGLGIDVSVQFINPHLKGSSASSYVGGACAPYAFAVNVCPTGGRCSNPFQPLSPSPDTLQVTTPLALIGGDGHMAFRTVSHGHTETDHFTDYAPNLDLPPAIVGEGPIVTKVERQYHGYFLADTRLGDDFKAFVDWGGGMPGTVSFSIAGGATYTEPADENGAHHSFALDSDFKPQREPSVITIRATDVSGRLGLPRDEELWVFDDPWLKAAKAALTQKPHEAAGVVTYNWFADYPDPHLGINGKSTLVIPGKIPFLGGRYGLTETFFRLNGEVSSSGEGRVSLSGRGGFEVTGVEIAGRASGGAILGLGPPDGLGLTGGFVDLQLGGRIHKQVGLLDAIPLLRRAESLPFIGSSISSLNKLVTLDTGIAMDDTLHFGYEAPAGASSIYFKESTGTVAITGQSRAEANLFGGRVKASIWGAISGAAIMGVPVQNDSVLREATVTAQAGAEIVLDGLISAVRATATGHCSWTPGSGLGCATGGELVDGDLFFVARAPHSGALTAVPPAATGTVITDVFRNASPRLIETSAGPLLLWVQQDPSLPPLQSTGIAWSLFDGQAWSEPALVARDTRVELSPVAAVDASGKIIAAWLRIHDPAFAAPVKTTADLASFYQQLDVVTAVFDPAKRMWGEVTELTAGAAMHTDLHLSRSPGGALMLTWLRNASGAFVSAPGSESNLRYSLWNGTSWSTAAAVASGLTGVWMHAVAMKNGAAVAVVPRDIGQFDVYRWTGSTWSVATAFTTTGNNQLPAVAYDRTGTAHIVWLRDGDLVHATLAAPQPQLVRHLTASASIAGLQLLAGPLDSITLVWTENVSNGPSQMTARVLDPKTQTWSEDLPLSSDAGVAHSVDAAYSRESMLRAVYVSTAVTSSDDPEMLDNGQSIVVRGVPHDGRSDLRIAEHTLITDLALTADDVTLDPPSPRVGETVVARIDVRNAGDLATSAFTLVIQSRRNVPIATATIEAPFRGGEHRVITLPFVYPGGPLLAVIDTANTVPEANESNNSAIVVPERRRSIRH